MEEKMKKKVITIIISIVLTLLFMVGSFYITLPAINLQNEGFWMFLFYSAVFFLIAYFAITAISNKSKNKKAIFEFKIKKKLPVVITACVISIPLIVLGIGSIVSSTFFNANAYSNLISVPEADFAEDMPETEVVNNIALMDTDTAIKMGNRTLGALSNVVSQYEISPNYRQINYKKAPQKIFSQITIIFFLNCGKKLGG